jgi:hypothetical protein
VRFLGELVLVALVAAPAAGGELDASRRSAASGGGARADEFKVKREAVFEFAARPKLTRRGDRISVSFESKGYCDVTVAVEDAEGRIVRHLASGVLGEKAPPPFARNSKRQTIVWDGKNDQGRYIDDKDSHSVRVSLGLEPRFERTLFWSPHKRVARRGTMVALAAAPEGVYVAEGFAVDHVRLFGHDGEYLRTIYPFPAAKVGEVRGLGHHTFVQSGRRLPLKRGYHQATLLTSGTNNNPKDAAEGRGMNAIAARAGRVAVAHLKLNRLASDGSSGGLALGGPATSHRMRKRQARWGRTHEDAPPRSAAFSPDGRYLYLTGFTWHSGQRYCFDWVHGVTRMEFAKDAAPGLFVGSLKQDDCGSGPGQFKVPTSVATDAKGRVYVSDYYNDRIQVFTPAGKFYKSIGVPRPAQVEVHQKTGEIYVFSWFLVTRYSKRRGADPTFTRLGPVENPRVITRCRLPLVGHCARTDWNNSGGLPFRLTLDSWAKRPTIWLVPGAAYWLSSGNGQRMENWKTTGVRLLVEKGGKLVERYGFGEEVTKAAVRLKPPELWRQRLYVNPANGRLYVAEGDSGVMKSFNQLVEVRPGSGRVRLVDLPLGAEDLCFGVDGLIYIRTDKVVARYDPRTWREVPFDYGEKLDGHSWGMGARAASLVSALRTPGHRSHNFWHLGGIDISVRGHLVVTTCNGARPGGLRKPAGEKSRYKLEGSAYVPQIYPGRMRWGEIHVYDRHGKKVAEDAVPGMGHLNGIGIDAVDNIYMLAASRRLIGGKGFDPKLGRDVSGTLVKVGAGRARVLSSSSRIPVPLSPASRPKRPADLRGYTTGWVKGAKWFYGGVGFCVPGGCVCWNSRFDLDYFNRSFAPEPLHYTVAVLDSEGNLITRVGNYGNVDDGKPLVAAGGPPRTNAMGGDEVALFHACYVAAHTDRRLFIADAGNARIVSVKLGYHAESVTRLRDVPDLARNEGKR